MDIQREREAFELVVANKLQNSLYHSVFFNEVTGRYDCADDAPAGVQAFCFDLNSYWRIWKAAKAQAVPSGFVVVPKEPTPKMIDATWDYDDEIQEMSHNSRNEFIYSAMIKAAQEPAND